MTQDLVTWTSCKQWWCVWRTRWRCFRQDRLHFRSCWCWCQKGLQESYYPLYRKIFLPHLWQASLNSVGPMWMRTTSLWGRMFSITRLIVFTIWIRTKLIPSNLEMALFSWAWSTCHHDVRWWCSARSGPGAKELPSRLRTNWAARININHILVDLPTPRYNEALDGKREAGERPGSGCLPDHFWDISGIFLGYLFTCPLGRDLGTFSPFFATSGLGQNPGEVQLSHHLLNRSFLDRVPAWL